VTQPVSVFDLWLEEHPSEIAGEAHSIREPDAHESSSHAAAERLLQYERWVRAS
jgi:hypothetical protein